jgi:putative ABC transport system substrate-binding protein
MRRRYFLAALLATPFLGEARAQPRLRRIAVVTLGSLEKHPVASLLEGLRELGYEHGRNIEILAPRPGAAYRDLPRMAAAAVEGGAEIIVAHGASATRAVKAATATIPVVMVVGADPVEMGFVGNLARPEANVTGLGTETQLLITKRVELLHEIVPGMKRLAVLWNSSSAGQSASFKLLREVSEPLGIQLQPVDLRGRDGLAGVSESLAKANAQGMIVLSATTLARLGPQLVELAARQRLPAVYADAQLVRQGGLAAYSPDARAQLRRAAHYVDRILKGAKPAQLAVEQPTKFELAVNLKTARALSLTIPSSLRLRADLVVE